MQNQVTNLKGERAVTFAAAATSNLIAIDGLRDLAVYLDGSYAGNALTFEVPIDEAATTFAAVNDGGSALTVTVTAAKWNILPAKLAAFKRLRLKSSGSETCTGILQGSS